MSALRLLRAEVTPPSTPRRGTQPAAPAAATSARLDLRRGRGLGARHRGGADQHGVDRHRRRAVRERPGPVQQVGGTLRRPDPAARADEHVRRAGAARGRSPAAAPRGPPTSGARPRGRPRGAPRSCGAARRRRSPAAGAPARRCPGLNALSAHALGGEPVEQRDRLVDVGDARRHRQPRERRARAPRAEQQRVALDVQLPQVAVEQQRVEDDLAPGLEQRRQLLDAQLERPPVRLPAARQLGHVARVGGGGDDRRVDRRRRHPGEDHRRPPGGARVARVEMAAARRRRGANAA